MDNLFKVCKNISTDLNIGQEKEARDQLILLLDELYTSKTQYPEIVNNLIRGTGLYPYMQEKHLLWEDKLILELFKQDVGSKEPVVLHREQSKVLKILLEGNSLAISAPTSFGKSFIIDAYIKAKKPATIVIIVPTIALTDETRRRLFRKFCNEYKIITTPDSALAKKNIFIFPQERALLYIDKIKCIDLLVIDEFYKASPNFDKERSHALIKSILLLGHKAKQRYYLAPNISSLPKNPLTEGMNFLKIDYNTVFTKIIDKYTPKLTDADRFSITKEVITQDHAKTLVYAGTYKNIGIITDYILESIKPGRNHILDNFSSWLKENYDEEYALAELVKRETGIHNGQLHRSLSQLQIKLFEEPKGLKNIISTSSIIEGVNTSAENVIIWSNRNGRPLINNFTYKNIAGRGGRMFKHFVGNVYLLDAMPRDEQIELNLIVDDSDLYNFSKEALENQPSSIKKDEIDAYQDEMRSIVGKDAFDQLLEEGNLIQSDSDLVRKIAMDIKHNPERWNSLRMLNSDDPDTWDNAIYLALGYCGNIGCRYSTFVEFLKIISRSWDKDFPTLFKEMKHIDLSINNYFDLEKNATYKLSTTLSSINSLIKNIIPNSSIDISRFISKVSSAFLPPIVFELEEYGLPRTLTKKIHHSGIYDFKSGDIDLHSTIKFLAEFGKDNIKSKTNSLHVFDNYIIDYFFEGIEA